MRTLAITLMVMLSGCAVVPTDQAAGPKPGTAVAFNANTDAELQEAAQRAKEWCAETYSEEAKFLDSRTDSTGNVVRFGCVPN
jgi:uncharacterized protein YceK